MLYKLLSYRLQRNLGVLIGLCFTLKMAGASELDATFDGLSKADTVGIRGRISYFVDADSENTSAGMRHREVQCTLKTPANILRLVSILKSGRYVFVRSFPAGESPKYATRQICVIVFKQNGAKTEFTLIGPKEIEMQDRYYSAPDTLSYEQLVKFILDQTHKM